MPQVINKELSNLIRLLNNPQLDELSIMLWASPIVSFGNISKSKIATLGINPSNREFVDLDGNELNNDNRRFHTLSSLGISNWSEVNQNHLQLILESCNEYFSRNPYDGWFKKLDYLMSDTSASYYFPSYDACHLDLIPFATHEKWSSLTQVQQNALLSFFGDTLGRLIADSSIEILLLNGQTVVNNFEKISNVQFNKKLEVDWELPRKTTNGVAGYSYEGYVTCIGGVNLNREIKVLGYNHNIQSSFGVSFEVLTSIRKWVSKNANIFSHEAI